MVRGRPDRREEPTLAKLNDPHPEPTRRRLPGVPLLLVAVLAVVAG
jgi:hypothetical protein